MTQLPPNAFAQNPCQTWDELRAAVEGRDWARIGRTEKREQAYRAWIAEQRGLWRTIEDRIWHTVFGCATETVDGSDTKTKTTKLMVSAEARQLISAKDLQYVPNGCPYDMPAGVDHWTVWSVQRPENPDEVVRGAIERAGHKLEEVVWFENDPNRRSVPGIWHVHVFVKTVSP